MELWCQVIIEWVNCIDTTNTVIQELKELEDGRFYKQLLDTLLWKERRNIPDEEDIVKQFIKEEYPEIIFNDESNPEELEMYIASLFLLYVSQESAFQQAMCTKLEHDTQLKIKSFLERIIPYGKNLTKNVLRESIVELLDTTVIPVTPRTRALKEYFCSPAARSAQSHKMLIEKNRELRKLMNELEVERFEKVDLQEDIKIQQNKIQHLHKKLEEKNKELKALREERTMSVTPQSCKKNKDTDREQYYKREIDRLEDQLMEKQCEVDTLETDNDNLTKKIACTGRQYVLLKEKLDHCEKLIENLHIQGEVKDRQLANLRLTNEELRAHLKELSKSAAEQSFEIDGILPLHSPSSSLNTSEALSSVIDLQLQEAKQESCFLKSQLDVLNKKLISVTQEHDKITKLNVQLQKKALTLQDTRMELNITLNKLSSSNANIEILQQEKAVLLNHNKNLENLCSCQKETLLQAEESKSTLNMEINELNGKIEDLEESLCNKNIHTSKLDTALAEAQLQITEKLRCIENLTEQNSLYRNSIETSNAQLKDIILRGSQLVDIKNDNLDDTTTVKLLEHLQELLQSLETKFAGNETEIESLNNTIKETTSNLEYLKRNISELEIKDEQSIAEISTLKENLQQSTLRINELSSTVHQYSEEIVNLKKTEIQKQDLERDLSILRKELAEKNSLLQSSTTRLRIVEKDHNNLKNELNAMREEVVMQLKECQAYNNENIQKISNNYKALFDNYNEEQTHRRKLENKLVDIEKELTNSRNTNTTLENNLLQKEETIHNQEIKLLNLKTDLETCTRDAEQLRNKYKSLEEKHINIVTEKDTILQNLQCENEKVSADLKDITNKHNLLQAELNNISKQTQLKDEQLTKLISEMTSLQLESEHLTRLQKEEGSKTRDFMQQLEDKLLEKQRSCDQLNLELKMKEDTLELVRNNFEKLTKETISSELKMKEVIMNLQEVRANQDALLKAQERALKEKCSHLEELQKEYNESKNTFNKRLEEEKSLRQNLQSTYSELQIQTYKQTKAMEELQDALRKEKQELQSTKEYYEAEATKKLEIVKVCGDLENSINDLKSTIVETISEIETFNTDFTVDTKRENNDEKTKGILKIVKTAINEVLVSGKLISHLFNTNTSLNKTLEGQRIIIDNYVTKCEEIKLLKEKVQELENIEEKRAKYFNNLIQCKKTLRDSLGEIVKSREELDGSLNTLKQNWSTVLSTYHEIFAIDKSVCDELKEIQAMKMDVENFVSKYNIYHLQNMKPLNTILWQKFLWTEENLDNKYLCSATIEKSLDALEDPMDNIFSEETTLIDVELEKNTKLQEDIAGSALKIKEFSDLVASFETNFKSDQTKFQSEVEKKLHTQIEQLKEEKNDVESKLNCLRLRNVNLEESLDELKNEVKEMKANTVPLLEFESLKKDMKLLKEENAKLLEERDELNKRLTKEDMETQVKEIHNSYKVKLDEIKQRMKAAYNEQVLKLNKDQEKSLQERLETLQKKMEEQCRKQAEEISKYKAHVTQMSSQIWNVGENLLTEQQQNQKLRKEIEELKMQLQNANNPAVAIEQKNARLEKRDFFSSDNKDELVQKIAIIQEKTTYERRCSIRSIQTMGNAFNVEDEQGEFFDNTYLADMKEGHATFNIEPDRLSVLQKRNALCKPHLKSSYPAEMQFHPMALSEEEIKSGSAHEDLFNDSLSQSLLPEQKTKKKDRAQTSYKKPGPPTPSKNGGRLSLQGNELKSPNSRILRERNKERTTATPRTLKSLFSSRRQDENTIVTPRGRRRSSIFRKYRAVNDR